MMLLAPLVRLLLVDEVTREMTVDVGGRARQLTLLAPAFQSVCDLWFKVPGILAATVSRDPNELNLVHDVRIFANHAAFQAHVDKSDPVLTSKMEQWFAHYDTSIPFKGELYMPSASTKDDAVRSSSIHDRPIRSGFSEFVFEENGIWGCPRT